MIFVDSSFWIAEFLPRDRRHPDAMDASRAFAGEHLVSSTAALVETWTYLRRRAGHERAMAWIDGVLGRRVVKVERVDADLETEAWAWLCVHDERPYSFVDATSFALMRKLRIREALAFDGVFGAAGFIELRP